MGMSNKIEAISSYLQNYLRKKYPDEIDKFSDSTEIPKERKEAILLLLKAQAALKLRIKRLRIQKPKKKYIREYIEKEIIPALEKTSHTTDVTIFLAVKDAIDATNLFKLKRQRKEISKKNFTRKVFPVIIVVTILYLLSIFGSEAIAFNLSVTIVIIITIIKAIIKKVQGGESQVVFKLLDKQIDQARKALESFINLNIFDFEEIYNFSPPSWLCEESEKKYKMYTKKDPNTEGTQISGGEYRWRSSMFQKNPKKYLFIIDEVSDLYFYNGRKIETKEDPRTKNYHLKMLKLFLIKKRGKWTFGEICDEVKKEKYKSKKSEDIEESEKGSVQKWVSLLKQSLGDDLEWLIKPIHGKGYEVLTNLPYTFCVIEECDS